MGIEEDVVAAAEDILQQTPGGLTKEALVRMIAPRVPNKLLPAKIIEMLRRQPQRFVEGGDGRWRLRAQAVLLPVDEPIAASVTNGNAALAAQLRQSWQNYIEAHFGIMRRLADYYLNKAPTLDEMKKAHRKFIRDYNCQIHFAHRERNDNRHSPQDVLRGVLARTLPAPTHARIFFATEFTRHLDRSGYIRFRRWRFYAEAGLAKQDVQVSIYTSTLKIEYQETELAFYTMEWEDNKRIKEVKNPHLIETGYRSPQLTLWTLGPDEWLLFLKLPDYAARKKPQRKPDVIQLPLPDLDENQRQQVSS